MNWEKFYYPVAYLVTGVLGAALVGTKVSAQLRLPFDVSAGYNFYWMLVIGSQIGLALYLVVQRQDDFWKRMIVLVFLSVVLFYRQLG